jgi:hypothetical protein
MQCKEFNGLSRDYRANSPAYSPGGRLPGILTSSLWKGALRFHVKISGTQIGDVERIANLDLV